MDEIIIKEKEQETNQLDDFSLYFINNNNQELWKDVNQYIDDLKDSFHVNFRLL